MGGDQRRDSMTPNESEMEISVDEQREDIPGDEADVYAAVSSGEYATVWCVFRYGDYEIATTTYRVHDGVGRRDSTAGKDYHEVEPSTDTKAWAESFAESHKTSVDVAKEFFATSE
jgi:hypothetical protein